MFGSTAGRHHVAGGAGSAGRDAGNHRHLRDGRLSVSKRLKELGILIALGAQRQEILQAALGRAFKLLAFGSAVGLLLGILASRVLAFIVFLGTPRDPLVLGAAVLSMLLLGLLATWIPAQRALAIDPLRLLREE